MLTSQIAVLISAGFIISWSPYGIVSLWCVLRDGATLPPVVTLLPCMFAKSSTVYNPLIYYTFSRSFKREVRRLATVCGVGGAADGESNVATHHTVYAVVELCDAPFTVIGDTQLSDAKNGGNTGAAADTADATSDATAAVPQMVALLSKPSSNGTRNLQSEKN